MRAVDAHDAFLSVECDPRAGSPPRESHSETAPERARPCRMRAADSARSAISRPLGTDPRVEYPNMMYAGRFRPVP